MKPEIRGCDDIGMFAIDRSIPLSCVHATDFCRSECYNEKLYKLYPAMHGKDIRNEQAWKHITGDAVREALSRKAKSTARVRLMTRGEAASDYGDIARLDDILSKNPDTQWWLPSRGWHNPIIRLMLQRLAQKHSNLSLLASIDPSDTVEDIRSLVADGWSTMYFGRTDEHYRDYADTMSALDIRPFMCPKTYGRKRSKDQKKDWSKAPCARCKRGCFKASTHQVHVQLAGH